MATDSPVMFDRFVLDWRDERLIGPDGPVKLGNKAFQVLGALIAQRGRLITKDEFFETVWDGTIVSESSLTSVIKELRRALGDDSRQPRFIESVYGRGYRFLLDVVPATRPPLPTSSASADPAPLHSWTASLERRRITAMACELRDWGKYSARGDPEELLLISETFREIGAEVAARHGGLIAQCGDHQLLLVFGYPVASEEDGAIAVTAGLALRDGLSRTGPPIPVRIGIATGTVLIKSDGAATPAVLGDAPEQARKLAAKADGGGILVAQSTRAVTQGLIAFGPGREIALDDGDERHTIYEALGTEAAASRSQTRSGEHLPFVGRAQALDQLCSNWQAARRGNGQVVLVRGEAGIGKTRLVQAFRAGLAADEGIFIQWQCGPRFGATALQPAAENLVRIMGIQPGDDSSTRAGKLAAWLRDLGVDNPKVLEGLAELLDADAGSAHEAEVTPERRRATTLDALLSLMDHLTTARPVLLVIEDLHWADPTTLALVDLALQRIPDRPWMILATARPNYVCSWFDQADVSLVELDGLGRGDAAQLCRLADSGGILVPSIVHRIVDRAEGNPLFLTEIARFAINQSADALEGVGDVELPDSIHDLLTSRLDRLGPAREVARIGAAIGKTFRYELIAAASDIPPAELRKSLRELARQGILHVRGVPPDSSYRFHHALMADAAYDTLPRREREALHDRIAETLRIRFSDMVDGNPALLADHLTRSGRNAEAIPYWIQAGAAAAAKAAHLEAAHSLRTALDLLRLQPRDAEGIKIELQLLIGLAVSLAATRGYAAADVAAVLGEARAICDAIGNEDSLFMVVRGLCAFSIVAGDLAAAEELALRCVAIANKSGLAEHRIESECPLGYVLWAKGQPVRARLHLERAIDTYLKLDGARLPHLTTQDPLIQCLGPLGLVCLSLGDRNGIARAAEMLERHARKIDDGFSVAFALFWRACLALHVGDLATAQRYGDEADELCTRRGYVSLAPTIAINRAAVMGELGNPQGGLAVAVPAMEDFTRMGQRHGRPYNLGETARLHAAVGDLEMAMRTNDEAISIAEEIAEPYWLARLYRRRAEFLAAMPRADPAAVRLSVETGLAIARSQDAAGFAAEIEALNHIDPKQGKSRSGRARPR